MSAAPNKKPSVALGLILILGVRVRAANARRSRSPAACCSASLIRSIPNRNSANPPNSGKISVLSVILPPFWVLVPLYGPGA